MPAARMAQGILTFDSIVEIPLCDRTPLKIQTFYCWTDFEISVPQIEGWSITSPLGPGTILDIFRWQLTSCWRKEPLNQSFVGSLSISPTACTWVPRRQEDLGPFIDLSLFKSISVGPHFKMEMQVSARMSISKVFSIQGEQQTSSIYLPSLQFADLSWGIWEPHVYLNDWFMWTQALQHNWFGPPEAPGGRLNIKMSSYQYRDPHVKDKTVSPTVLSLTWEPPYLGKTVFILRQGPASVGWIIKWSISKVGVTPALLLQKHAAVYLQIYCGTHTKDATEGFRYPGPRFNIKMSSYQYSKSHCGDKTVVRSSYLHNGISYTGKMSSLYWIRALDHWTASQNVSARDPHWLLGMLNFMATLVPKGKLHFCPFSGKHQRSGPGLNMKTVFPRYGDSHYKDETFMRPSYLYNGNPYTGKTTSLYMYCDGLLVPRLQSLPGYSIGWPGGTLLMQATLPWRSGQNRLRLNNKFFD